MGAHSKEPRRKRGATRKIVLGVTIFAAVLLLSAGAYYVKEPAKRIFARPVPPDTTLINHVVDSVLVKIQPAKTRSSSIDLGGRQIRQDRLELSKKSSISRANLDITRAVQNTGGQIAYGVESSDEKRKVTTVTLGISDGQRLVREIRLDKTVK